MVHAATANDSAITITPSWVARRSGRSEKLVRPSSARRTMRPQRVVGVAGEARVALVLDRALREPDPRDHAPHVAVALGHLVEDVDDLAVEQAEVAGLARERDLGDPVHQAVVDLAGEQLEPGLAARGGPHAVDDLEAVAPALDHLGDDLGRILEVGVDHDDRVAACVVDAGARAPPGARSSVTGRRRARGRRRRRSSRAASSERSLLPSLT